MKQTIILFVLFSVTLLFAEMSEPAIFWPNSIDMSRQNSIVELDGEILLTFRDKDTNDIIFMRVIDSDSINHFVIDNSQDVITIPTITATDQSDVLISYTRGNGHGWDNVIAKSVDNGQSFDVSVLEDVHLVNPIISWFGGVLKLTGISGSEAPLNRYEIFLDNSFSENVNEDGYQRDVLYYGKDIFRGRVHHNGDIWIGQFGGGDNNGWPTFYDHVSTSGRFRMYPSGNLFIDSAPTENIFLGGYSEQIPPVQVASTLDELQQNGTVLGIAVDILYIELEGESYTGFEGSILADVLEFPVYSWYPANTEQAQAALEDGVNWLEESNIINTNYLTVYDTIWTPISGSIPDGSSFYTDAELWIHGEITGIQVWGSSKKVRILGDITYTNTEVGECPDGFTGYDNWEPQFDGDSNETDYFGLLCEGRINIGYKYFHPESGEKVSVTTSMEDDIYLYGAYAALGIGDENLYGDQSHYYDGMFTFEYQHPHGSTPHFTGPSPFTGNDTLFNFIDYHKFIVPANDLIEPALTGFNIKASLADGWSSGYPNLSEEYAVSYPNTFPYAYPLGSDYPLYNPVWPEPFDEIIFERGNLKIFGSKLQRTSGYLHRSGQDPINHNNSDVWDLDNHDYACGHPSTGYNSYYHFDHRFMDVTLSNFPSSSNDPFAPKIVVMESEDLGDSFTSFNTLPLEPSNHIFFDKDMIVMEGNNIAVKINSENPYFLLSSDLGENWFTTELGNTAYQYRIHNNKFFHSINNGVRSYTIPELELDFEDTEEIAGYGRFTPIEENICMVSYSEDYLTYNYTIDEGDSFEGLLSQYLQSSTSLRSMNAYGFDNDLLLVLIQFYHSPDYVSPTKFVYGTLEGMSDLTPEEVPELKPTLFNFPNPFNPSTEIRFSLNTEDTESTEIAELEIYNIKGQRVREFKMENVKLQSGSDGSKMNIITWHGTDQNNHPVASGVYYYTLKLDGKTTLSRKMVLLK